MTRVIGEAVTALPLLPSLNSVPPEEATLLLGELLYPLVEALISPAQGPKITGMLLESLEPNVLLHLLHVPDALKARVEEALTVLREHEAQAVPALPSLPSLNSVHPEEATLLLGELLYPLVEALISPAQGPKITGMLLESLEPNDLLHLLHMPDALKARVEEALTVLREHEAQAVPALPSLPSLNSVTPRKLLYSLENHSTLLLKL